jgi:uncharacterized surface protein with fasciclin (FAS1) repeats
MAQQLLGVFFHATGATWWSGVTGLPLCAECNKAKLTAVLTYHVVPGRVMAKDVKAGSVKTVQGGLLTLGTTGGVTVNNAKVVQADVVASNGVIHVIDTVVLPK